MCAEQNMCESVSVCVNVCEGVYQCVSDNVCQCV